MTYDKAVVLKSRRDSENQGIIAPMLRVGNDPQLHISCILSDFQKDKPGIGHNIVLSFAYPGHFSSRPIAL